MITAFPNINETQDDTDIVVTTSQLLFPYILHPNENIHWKMIEFLGIKIEILRESELDVNGESTERLVNICETLNADTYVSGIGGKNYLNEKLFGDKNIKLEYQNYRHIPYQQIHSKDFIPDLSIIDLISNLGEQSLDLIKKSRENI